jgi:hypothetical protein
MLNAAYWATRNAGAAVRSALSVRLRRAAADLRGREFTVHDTHTPVIRRQARAIREGAAGPTPRAEADWSNRLYTTVNETLRDDAEH